jgi:hypothetical protein
MRRLEQILSPGWFTLRRAHDQGLYSNGGTDDHHPNRRMFFRKFRPNSASPGHNPGKHQDVALANRASTSFQLTTFHQAET